MPPFVVDIAQSSTHYLFSTVRLEGRTVDGRRRVGTAFFFGDRANWRETFGIVLVTNRHVIKDCSHVQACVHIADPSRDHRRFSVDSQRVITIPLDHWIGHPDPEVDLCAASLPRLVASLGGLPDLFFIPIGRHTLPPRDEEQRYPAIMQIAMAGYPNGLWDEYNNLPLLRRGTTASHPAIDFDTRAEIAVDMACFPGSSGSPIWFHDTQYFASAVRFLGVLYAGPTIGTDGQFLVQPISSEVASGPDSHSMMHLGYAIKARRVAEVAAHVPRTAGA